MVLYNAPVNIGSGGTCGTCMSGGGAVILNVTNQLTVNGPILAKGNGGGNNGSGGSIFLTVGTLAGNGTLDASGGSAGTGGAGGGRIAVIGSTASFAGAIAAYGGTGSNPGAAGTIFIKSSGTNGTLIVNNNNLLSARGTFLGTSTSSGSYTFDSIQTLGLSSMTFVSFSSVTIVSTGNVFWGWRLHLDCHGKWESLRRSDLERHGWRLDGDVGDKPGMRRARPIRWMLRQRRIIPETLISSVTLNRATRP